MLLEVDRIDTVVTAIKNLQPDVIIHLAAIASPAKCHQDQAKALAVNAPLGFLEVVKQVVPECLFIFSSTDMVYDGEHAPYAEQLEEYNQSDECPSYPSPVNVYGESKLTFEQSILSELPNGIVLRLSNMIGPPFVFQPAGEKFLQWLYNAYTHRSYIGLKDDEIRSFVAVDDVVIVIEKLTSMFFERNSKISWSPQHRVLNVGGPHGLSRLQVAEILCQEMKCVMLASEFENNLQLVAEGENVWKVYRLQTQNTQAGALKSPKDITMLVSRTEEMLEMRFRLLTHYFRDCLFVC